MSREDTIRSFMSADVVELRNTTGNHNKYWKAAVGFRNSPTTPTFVVCEWGPIDGTAQDKTFYFASAADARAFVAKKADEKTQKGYRVVDVR